MSIRSRSPRPDVDFFALALAAVLGAGALLTTDPSAAQGAEGDTTAEPPTTSPAASASTEPETFAEILEVRVVNVDVFVTDRDGHPVQGLGRDHFELFVDGEPMPISNFYHEAGGRTSERTPSPERRSGTPSDSGFVPLESVQTGERRNHVVLLVDHTRLESANRKRAFRALEEAVARLDGEDLVAVVGIERSLVFYSDFLYDRSAIRRILDDFDDVAFEVDHAGADRRRILGELARGQSGGVLGRTSTANPEGLMARIRAYAAQEYARSLHSLRQMKAVIETSSGVLGGKTVLYLGEGIPTRPGEGLWVEWRNRFGGGNPNAEIGLRRFDFDTDYTRAVGRYDLTRAIEEVAETANRSEVTLYAVDPEAFHGGELRSAQTEQGSTSESVSVVDANFRAPLEYTTRTTGGLFLRSSGDLGDRLAGVFADLDNFYSLGFVPPAEWEPGSAHEIEVKVREGRHLVVRHREEVVLPEPDEREARATVTALMYQSLDNPLEIRADPAGESVARDDGSAVLPVLLEIPVDNLELLPRGETHAASLSIFVSVKAADGNPRPVQKLPFHLNIPGDRLREAKSRSAHYTLPLVLRPGDRQVAITVRDDVSRSLSAIGLDVARFAPDPGER